MHSRKRRAPEPLLPLRAPKQARTTLKGYAGGYPQQGADGLFSRWFGLGKDFIDLSCETAVKLVPESSRINLPLFRSMTPTSRHSTLQSTARPHATSLTSPHASSNSPQVKSSQKNSPQINLSHANAPNSLQANLLPANAPGISQSPKSEASTILSSPPPGPENLPSKHCSASRSKSRRSRTVSNSYDRNDSLTIVQPQDPDKNGSGSHIPLDGSTSRDLQSKSNSIDNLAPEMDNLNLGPTMRDFGFQWPKDYVLHPQVDEALARTPMPQKASSAKTRAPSRRPRKNREHIYAKIHKANLVASKNATRKEILRELYAAKRRGGYTSGFSDFEGLLAYQYKLEKVVRPDETSLDGRAAPAPSTDDDQTDFLKVALDKAHATLRAPKPPQPFIPSLEQLQKNLRRKDAEIERQRRPALPESLSPEDEAKVKGFLGKRGVVSKFGREQVSDKDIIRLRPGQWLNDEIINFYGAMLLARSDGSKENPGTKGKKPLNVHYFSTFFWSKLVNEGYEQGRLAKWTKKIDLFTKDVVLIPVNHSNSHWTAAAINFRQKRIESYDSMNVAKDQVFRQLRLYLDAEHRNKKKKPFDFTGWENWAPEDTPQQENGYDCGVFTCQFLEYLSRGEEGFIFAQKDMPYLRRKMVWEIGNGKLRDDY